MVPSPLYGGSLQGCGGVSGAPRTRVHSTEDMQGSAGGRLHRGLPRGPGLGLRAALPGAIASAKSPTSLLETKLNALVTVLKKIQSREPSGWRTAERRRGWRCRGYGGGRGRGGRSYAISLPRARTTVFPSLQLGVSGPGAERPHLDLLPGPCTRGPQGDAAGAALATCGGAGKALPLQRVPGVGAWKGPWECYAPRRLCGFSSPTRLPLLLSSRGPQRWRGGGKGGGLADRAGWGAGARELGESDVPTPSGDRGPGAARPAARGGAGGTTGQQRPLQVPGASAAAARTQLLRWHHRVPSPRAARSPGSIRRMSPSSSGPAPERPECADGCCYLLDPFTLPLIQDFFRGCPASDFDRRPAGKGRGGLARPQP
ncbi:spidroin-2 [Pongo abelii]|uniref:spidroin-2 n=1 Tax=Pongo abelii TaxID=9601 RepID=UPI0023E8BB7B|nr:spidroin-2 [Pongo abelii]